MRIPNFFCCYSVKIGPKKQIKKLCFWLGLQYCLIWVFTFFSRSIVDILGLRELELHSNIASQDFTLPSRRDYFTALWVSLLLFNKNYVKILAKFYTKNSKKIKITLEKTKKKSPIFARKEKHSFSAKGFVGCN
jgi:hypothetical protein